jgi:hypothetical protein
MKGLGLKLLKIHLLFLAFLPLFIDKTPNPNPEVKLGSEKRINGNFIFGI